MLVGKRVLKYREIDSTNDEAKRLVKAGEPEGTVILAQTQSKGRGKPGRHWFSPQDQGLYLSVILKPLKNLQELDPLVLLGAEAAVAAIDAACGIKAGIKKPNDIMIDGKKVGGVLVERIDTASEVPSLVIGIGLNVNTKKFPKDLQKSAASLRLIAGKEFDRQALFSALLQALDKGYLKFLKGSV